jgi:hypothetical protein
MIYLIDDKKLRQESLNWSKEKFEIYSDLIKPIYNYKELDLVKLNMFENQNIIIFHESFFDNPINKADKNADKIKQDLIDYANKKNFRVVFFSGSNGSRKIINNLAYTFPLNLYSNLEYVIKKYKNDITNLTLKDFLFGEKYKEEEFLILKKEISELLYRKETKFNNLFKLQKLVEQFNTLSNSNIILNDTIDNSYLKFQLNSIKLNNE